MRRTINILATLGVLAVSALSLAPVLAAAATCDAPGWISVDVNVVDPQPKINHTKTLNYINGRAKNHGLLKKNGLVLGLTHSEVLTSLKWKIETKPFGNKICFNITEVDADFGHRTLEVLVPHEYHPGTCQYNTVMRHENEHVRVNREGVRKYAKLLRKEMEKAVYRFNPRQVANSKTAEDDARRVLQGAMRRVSQKYEADMQKKHANIDKPGGPYDASGACRKWK